MPCSASGLQYGAGFVLATALLHCVGIGIGVAIGLLSSQHEPWITPATGCAMALAGVAMLSGMM
jgi:urease accessory protein